MCFTSYSNIYHSCLFFFCLCEWVFRVWMSVCVECEKRRDTYYYVRHNSTNTYQTGRWFKQERTNKWVERRKRSNSDFGSWTKITFSFLRSLSTGMCRWCLSKIEKKEESWFTCILACVWLCSITSRLVSFIQNKNNIQTRQLWNSSRLGVKRLCFIQYKY